jgi:hypothetical protein
MSTTLSTRSAWRAAIAVPIAVASLAALTPMASAGSVQQSSTSTSDAARAACEKGDITVPWRVRAAWAGVHIYGDLNADNTANMASQLSTALPADWCVHRRVGQVGDFVNRGEFTLVLGPQGWGWIMRDAIYGIPY